MGVGEQMLAAQARAEAKIDALSKMVANLLKGGGGGGGASYAAPPQIATEDDLDGERGNPEISKDPKKWADEGGASYIGRRFSQCPADYLMAMAGLLDWKARTKETEGKATGDDIKIKYALYDRLDAARARGWAKRNQAAGKTSGPSPKTGYAANPFPPRGEDDDGSL